ncbi:hypothetical protein CLFE_027190 [Clostridium felsineum DSM 794]|nr:hypothetical protein CLFE_027190 [Clostridium felsineum DSM 794]
MNKMLIKIIAIVVSLAFVVGVIYYFMHRGRSVGMNSSIVNEDNKKAKIDMRGKRALVVYFSESGNTQKLAKTISDQVGGDFRRIEPVKVYPTGQELFDYTKKERDNNGRPKFKNLNINMYDYDVIFVGYPMWWYTLPMIMYTFFDEYDFSGKTIIPFNTHEGSGDGGTYSTIKKFEPKAKVLDGLAIRGGDMQSDQTETVIKWLDKLGLAK